MKTRLDLEQEILDAWGIVEDLDLVFEYIMNTPTDKVDQDKLANMILGIKQLHDLKFQRLFDTFEHCLKTREI